MSLIPVVKINWHYPVFPDLTTPKGCLPKDKRAQACWYFYTIAQATKEIVGNSIDDQIILEESPWMDKRYEQIAWTVCMMYQIESPSEFAKFWDYVRQEARNRNLPEPAGEYTNLIRGKLLV